MASAEGLIFQYRFVLPGLCDSVGLPFHSPESWWLIWTKEDGTTPVQMEPTSHSRRNLALRITHGWLVLSTPGESYTLCLDYKLF